MGIDIKPILVLNDQGGAVMYVTHDVTGTLRHEEHGHPPLVFDARGNGWGAICPTITGDHNAHTNDYMAVVVEQHEDTNREKVL